MDCVSSELGKWAKFFCNCTERYNSQHESVLICGYAHEASATKTANISTTLKISHASLKSFPAPDSYIPNSLRGKARYREVKWFSGNHSGIGTKATYAQGASQPRSRGTWWGGGAWVPAAAGRRGHLGSLPWPAPPEQDHEEAWVLLRVCLCEEGLALQRDACGDKRQVTETV